MIKHQHLILSNFDLYFLQLNLYLDFDYLDIYFHYFDMEYYFVIMKHLMYLVNLKNLYFQLEFYEFLHLVFVNHYYLIFHLGEIY